MSASRRKARYLCCQALYQWRLSEQAPAVILRQFIEKNSDIRYDSQYFSTLFIGVSEHYQTLYAVLLPVVEETVLTPIEELVLLVGIYELQYQAEVPTAVVINEALLTAKKFGTTEGYTYVNALLDRLARELRHEGK